MRFMSTGLKRVMLVGVMALVILGAYFLGTTQAPLSMEASENDSDLEKTITVQGTGKVSAKPDRVIINLGVETREETASAAQQTNAVKMQRIIASLKKQGVKESNITTTSLSLRPVYEHPEPKTSERRIVGYEATNMVSVKTSQLDAVGNLIDQAVAAGANRVNNIEFTFEDDSQLRDEAIKKAVADARHKAELMAGEMNLTITGVKTISESHTVSNLRVSYAETAMDATTPVNPGEQTITYQVNVVFTHK